MGDGEKIEVVCGGCGTKHKLPASAAGKTLGCPACGTDLSVPSGPSAAAPPKEEGYVNPFGAGGTAESPAAPPEKKKEEGYVNPFGAGGSGPPPPEAEKKDEGYVNPFGASAAAEPPQPGKKEEGGYVNPFQSSTEEAPAPSPGGGTYYQGETGGKDENAPRYKPAEKGPPPDFFKLLNKAFAYPFSGGLGILFILFMGGMVAIGRGATVMPLFMVWVSGFVVLFIAWGYIASYIWAILNATALNDHRLPQMPDVTSISDIFLEAIRLYLATFWAFFPALAVLLGPLFMDRLDLLYTVPHLTALGATALFGVIYYPISLLIVGFANSMFAPLNYCYGIKLMFRAPKGYAICVLYFIGTALGFGSFEVFVGKFVGDNFLVVILSFPVFSAVSIYLYMLQIRVLGIFYLCNSRELSFFGEKEREAELAAADSNNTYQGRTD